MAQGTELGDRLLRRGRDGDSRLWAEVHLVSRLRGQDTFLAIEGDVLLLGFVRICPVDLLRHALQLLLSDGVPAVGEAFWEELERGISEPQEGRSGASSGHPLLGAFQKPAAQRRAAVRHPHNRRTGSSGLMGPQSQHVPLPTECSLPLQRLPSFDMYWNHPRAC